MQLQFYNIINDELRGSEKTETVTNPRTEDELWPCPVASNQDFEDAVAAAQKALTTWGRSPVEDRQAALVKMAEVLKEHAAELGISCPKRRVNRLSSPASTSKPPSLNASTTRKTPSTTKSNTKTPTRASSQHTFPSAW